MRLPFLLLCLPLTFAGANEPARFEPGLLLRLSAGGRGETRVASLVSLDVPAGESVASGLPPGAFAAKWEGEILSEQEADYVFTVAMRGAFTLTLNGELVLEGAGDNTVQTMDKIFRLKKGGTSFVAVLQSDGTQDASVRLSWQTKNGAAELVPPSAFRHDANDPALRDSPRKAKP